MVKLREISRTATFAWAPSVEDPMLVTGTKAGAIDADFDSTTQLEFWDLNLTNRSGESSKLDNSKVRIEINDSRFYDIAWGGASNAKPRGFVAGGHESGKLNIWDAQTVLDGSGSKSSTTPFHSSDKHSGAIKALQFSPVQSHLLATAGAKGEYFVWDMNKISSPYAPGTQSGKLDEIDTVAWNNHVSHIIATGGNTGFTTVYDLKNKREVMHLHYSGPNGRCKVSSVTWAPNTSTNLITACNDDGAPVILTWDLRNANAPAQIMKGHDRGVLSVDWCKNDENLLLSSAMDNRTFLWNPQTGEKLGEYPIATNWSFKTAFNDKAPDLFATASFDGKITVQTLQDTSTPEQAQKKPEGDAFWDPSAYADTQHPTFNLQQAPKWLKRPVSAHFGFGGKIVQVSSAADSGTSTVSISTFAGEEGINEDTAKFSEQLKSGDLAQVATEKVESSSNESEKYDWQVISALFGEGSRKEKLAQFLESSEPQQSDSSSITTGASSSNKKKKKKNGKKQQEAEPEQTEEAAAAKKDDADENDPFANSTDDFLGDVKSSTDSQEKEQDKYVPSGSFTLLSSAQNDDAENRITRAVLEGQFEKAVDICLQEDRITDAFLLALNGSDDIKAKVRNSYVSKNASTRPFVRLLNSVTSNDLNDVVSNANVSEWREIITGLFTYVEDEKTFAQLCGKLGDRLLEARDANSAGGKKSDDLRNSAVLCYLAGTNLEKTAQIWLAELSNNEQETLKSGSATPYAAHVKALHTFIEKITVFRRAIGSSNDFDTSENMDHLFDAYREYANIVASHGNLEMAEQYLDLLPSQYPGVSLEKERVQRATTSASKRQQRQARTTGGAASAYAPAASVIPSSAASHARNESAGQPSIYAPAQPSVPAGPKPSYAQPVRAPAAPVAAAAPSVPAPANPYQPTPNPYQPAAPAARPAPGPAMVPPPPRASGASPAQTQAAPVKPDHGWNDLPAGAVSTQARRATPSTTIRSPFPNQPAQSPPPPPSGGANRPPSQGVPPPPRAGVPPPPKSASPVGPPPQQAQAPPPPPPPQTNSRYAPQSPAQAPAPPINAGGPPPPPQNGQATGFQQPPVRSTPPPPPPANPYAPPPQQQQTSPANNPYAPVPGQAAAPPMRSPMAPPAQVAPPPPPATAAAQSVQQQQQQVAPQPEKAPSPPPAPKHPSGDRSHIPAEARPIFEILNQEYERVEPIIPQNFAKQLKDCKKRLGILFDHLNNEDVDGDTVNDMVQLAQAVGARDYDMASQIHVDIVTTRNDKYSQWLVGVKRLVEMGRVAV